MNMLRNRQRRYAYGTPDYWKIQYKIEDLLHEGKCQVIWDLRYRLVGAARASDNEAILNISEQIRDHVKEKHRSRFERDYIKKG